MNLTRAQKVRLGTFMVSGSFIFGVGLVALTGLQIWERRDTYTVRYQEDVGGLEVSAPVKYRGLRVGRVQDMYIAPGDTTSIEVVLALDPRTELHEGTKAVLDRSGLTGLKTINLVPGDPTKPVIAPGSELPAGQSFFDRITGKLEVIAVKVEVVANQLAVWTNDENRKRVEKLLDSLTDLSRETDGFLATNREPLRDALNGVARASYAVERLGGEGNDSLKAVREDVQKTLEETRVTLQEVRRPLEKIDSQELADTVVATRRAMTSLDQRLSAEEMGLAIAGLVKALDDLTRLVQALDLSVRAGREDFVMTLAELRQAAEDIREFSRIIAQDPSVLIRGKE